MVLCLLVLCCLGAGLWLERGDGVLVLVLVRWLHGGLRQRLWYCLGAVAVCEV